MIFNKVSLEVFKEELITIHLDSTKKLTIRYTVVPALLLTQETRFIVGHQIIVGTENHKINGRRVPILHVAIINAPRLQIELLSTRFPQPGWLRGSLGSRYEMKIIKLNLNRLFLFLIQIKKRSELLATNGFVSKDDKRLFRVGNGIHAELLKE